MPISGKRPVYGGKVRTQRKAVGRRVGTRSDLLASSVCMGLGSCWEKWEAVRGFMQGDTACLGLQGPAAAAAGIRGRSCRPVVCDPRGQIAVAHLASGRL